MKSAFGIRHWAFGEAAWASGMEHGESLYCFCSRES